VVTGKPTQQSSECRDSASRGDAKSAASLNEAVSPAVKARFEIIDAQKKVVADGLVGGEPVSVLPSTRALLTPRCRHGS
jgi:hypothetical protein